MSANRPLTPSAIATEIAFRFIRDLQAGKNPRIEDAVVMAPPNEWETVLHSLIIAEVNARRNGGELPTLGEYLARFPDSAVLLGDIFPNEVPTPTTRPIPTVTNPPVPVAQFITVPVHEPEPIPEPSPAVPNLRTAQPHLGTNQSPSNRPVWLLIGGGAAISIVACVAVVMSLIPTQKEPTIAQKSEETKPTIQKEDPIKKGFADPERETAEWVLSVGGRGVLQSNRGRVSLAADVDLPKGSFVIEAITLPAASASRWNEADLGRLRWREKLASLDITHPTALTSAALENIRTHPLQSLELRGTHVGMTGSLLTDLPNLERLTLLSAPDFSDADMVALGKLDKLHTFKINSPKITANGMAHLNKLSLLRSLTLGADCTLTADHFRVIQTVPLEELASLGGMTDDVFAECAIFLNLKRCQVQNANIGDAGFKAVGGMRKLEEIRVFGSRIGNESFKLLAEIKTLQAIEIRGSTITPEGLEGLEQLPLLRELRLPGSPLTDKAAETFANMESLEILELSDCNITDATLNTLNKHAKLKSLILLRTKVTPKGVEVFRQGTPKCNVVWK